MNGQPKSSPHLTHSKSYTHDRTPHAIHTTPTFCWDPLIVSSEGDPVLAAYKYRLQVSRGDPTFSTIYEQVETEQSCWTSTRVR
jgi:hypothetical protein